MKSGINIWSFGEATLEQAFQTARAAGLDGLEVALDLDGALTGLDSGPSQWQRIRDMAQANGLELYSVASGLYWDYGYTSGDAKKREKAVSITRKQLEMAASLGCDTILVVPGAVGAEFSGNLEIVDYGTAYQRAGEALAALAEDAKNAGVVIGVENVWNKFLTSPWRSSRR